MDTTSITTTARTSITTSTANPSITTTAASISITTTTATTSITSASARILVLMFLAPQYHDHNYDYLYYSITTTTSTSMYISTTLLHYNNSFYAFQPDKYLIIYIAVPLHIL